ncbi:hypothetical protein [Pontibacter anaerobius]|uniref:Uncharacterized protein n=1 Tax=Pontibacter anaerobius TaxID=2993940 RepID=A0ABT3RD70_9BACT|nr:hypothetical protein [Pontibacter anaerobius]MCX2739383.1 hypothetical protein [Pontibacter anaerobius]
MKIMYLLLLLAFSGQLVLAQSTRLSGLEADNNLRLLGTDGTSSAVRLFDNRYAGVKGNPFFRNEWCKAKIYMGNLVFEDVNVKYDLYDNKLLIKNSEGKVYEALPVKVNQLELQDSLTHQTYVMKRADAMGAADLQLAQRLAISIYEGDKVKLYLMPQKTLLKASYQESYSANRTQDEFVYKEDYYLITPGNAVKNVKLSKRNLLKALPNKQKEVEAYIASERINLGTASGWAKALAFYESL